MAGNIAVHLFLTLLALSSLVSARSLLHLPDNKDILAPEVTLQTNQGGYMTETTNESAGDELNKYRRMDFEFTSNDYPGLGANDRHKPHPQLQD